MKTYRKKTICENDALFKETDVFLDQCVIKGGAYPLCHTKDFKLKDCLIASRHAMQYADTMRIENSEFDKEGTAPCYFSSNIQVVGSKFYCDKPFRYCSDLSISYCSFNECAEILWNCSHLTMKKVQVDHGLYFMRECDGLLADDIDILGDYAFEHTKNLRIMNSVLKGKYLFYASENIILENCVIDGSNFGYGSKNLILRNCKISSERGFKDVQGISMRDCEIVFGKELFENCSDLDVVIVNEIESIRNPQSGTISCPMIREIYIDDVSIDYSKLHFNLARSSKNAENLP